MNRWLLSYDDLKLGGQSRKKCALRASVRHMVIYVKHVSVRHDLRATMTLKPLREDMSTATHVHVSIHSLNGQENFLVGILNSL